MDIQFHREPNNSYFALLTYLSQANLILQQFVTLSHSYLARLQIYESRILCSVVCNFEQVKCSSNWPGSFDAEAEETDEKQRDPIKV